MIKSMCLLMFSLLLGQADQAIMTLYKDGFALVKQPVNWPNVPAGVSTLEYNQLPSRLFMDSPFLTLQDEIVVRWHKQQLKHPLIHCKRYLSPPRNQL